MRFSRVADGIYKETETGVFYERPWVNGKRTWRKLDAGTLKIAKEELASRRTDQKRAFRGMATDPYIKPHNIGELIRQYISAGCPTNRQRQRNSDGQKWQQYYSSKLIPFWNRFTSEQIKPALLDEYFSSRKKEMRTGADGGRLVDIELSVLANALKYAVRAGKLQFNPMPIERPKYRPEHVRHSREVMPSSGTELHRLARCLFSGSPSSEVLGWWLLIQAMTGCRSNELLRLRVDASSTSAPGFMDKRYLYLARSKKGVNPWQVLHPPLRKCLKAFREWHSRRFSGSPWWFPNFRDQTKPCDAGALGHAMNRIAPIISQAHRTPHGLRAFYVTVRRSQGVPDAQIAAEIGDKTTILISTTYGEIPPNWRGGPELAWMPTKEPAAWEGIEWYIPRYILEAAEFEAQQTIEKIASDET